MIKTIKKVFLGSVSILGISLLVWTVFLINPNLSYAHQTQIDKVTIFHNQELEEGTALIVRNALEIIKSSDIYDKSLNIEFCLNDDEIYPKLNPFAGATAYAFLNKTVMYASTPNFKDNVAEFTWEINNNELRKYNLTRLLAHEFMNNFQHKFDSNYYFKSTLGKLNWKLEGHAEYIARGFKNDGLLKNKIDKYLTEEKNDHTGVPFFYLNNGTVQNLSYYEYALVIQYLMEVKGLDFNQISELNQGMDTLFQEMIEWSTIKTEEVKY